MEGENVATENGGDPPVKGASFGGAGYDGGVKSFGKGSDGNLDTEISQINMNSKTSSPSSGSFGLGGGGSGRSGNKYGNLEEYRTWRDYQGYHKNESWFDHFCRMVNSNHMDIMRDEGSGGGLMYGGFGRGVKAAEAAENATTKIMRVGQHMTADEFASFSSTNTIPRGNVLYNNPKGFSDINLTHYAEFDVDPNILKLKDATRSWYQVIPNSTIYQKLYQSKGLTMPSATGTNIKLISPKP